MFENLTNKLESIFSKLKKAPSLNEEQVDSGLKEIRQALLEAEFVSNVNKRMYPFKERDNADLLISDNEIKSIQLDMDPTLDEGALPVTHVDMTVGFDAESRDRVNSIVYRGMTRR